MKNASLLFICCILFVTILPICIKSHHLSLSQPQKKQEEMIRILDVSDNSILKIPLEEYAWRVAAKEMPLSFHDEALKAQIVVARTYALRKRTTESHESKVDICTDHTHCTAFLSPDEDENLSISDKKMLINLAITTQNEIITYNNQPILAVFHATSSGITEKSSDIWQTQLPYLTNVESSVDKSTKGYLTQKSFNESEIKKIFNTVTTPTFKNIVHTDAGGVKTIEIDDKIYTGTDVRNLLKLRSNNFTVSHQDEMYTFTVKGYGHGVGMSQTGANELAHKGLTYKDILLKYYPGTEINYLNSINMTK